jgi:hypothetical protein
MVILLFDKVSFYPIEHDHFKHKSVWHLQFSDHTYELSYITWWSSDPQLCITIRVLEGFNFMVTHGQNIFMTALCMVLNFMWFF